MPLFSHKRLQICVRLRSRRFARYTLESRGRKNFSDFKCLVGEMAQRFKIEEAKKTALAIHDYSVTGDIRMLLVLQRHLTSTRDDNGDT